MQPTFACFLAGGAMCLIGISVGGGDNWEGRGRKSLMPQYTTSIVPVFVPTDPSKGSRQVNKDQNGTFLLE